MPRTLRDFSNMGGSSSPSPPPSQAASYSVPAYSQPPQYSVPPGPDYAPSYVLPSTEYAAPSTTTSYVYTGSSSLGQPLPPQAPSQLQYTSPPQQGYQQPYQPQQIYQPTYTPQTYYPQQQAYPQVLQPQGYPTQVTQYGAPQPQGYPQSAYTPQPAYPSQVTQYGLPPQQQGYSSPMPSPVPSEAQPYSPTQPHHHHHHQHQQQQQQPQPANITVTVNYNLPTNTNPFTGVPVIPNSSAIATPRSSPCPKCNGKGKIHDTIHSCGINCIFCEQCSSCLGRGNIDGNIETCGKCQGKGKYHESIHSHSPGCIFCTKCAECGTKGYIQKAVISALPATPVQLADTFPGYYTIVNVMTRMAIDGNVNIARQMSPTHPRPFLGVVNPNAKNHQWVLQPVEHDLFTISLRDTNVCLDGNNEPNIPQSDPRCPAPFLWAKLSKPNHHWRVQRVGPETYLLINRHNNLSLDGSTYLGVTQWDFAHPAPFLAPPDSQSLSQQWIIHRVA